MADNAGATEDELAVAEYILQDALQSDDPLVKNTAEQVVENRRHAAAVATSLQSTVR
jgi:hypothetical protein